MAEKSFDLDFDGYWLEEKTDGMPERSGIYCVYTCVFNQSKNTVSLVKLIYIGEAGNVRERIGGHEKWPRWRRRLEQGQQICLSFAPVGSADRDRVEAALIYKHKPPVNEEYVDSFPFDNTHITTIGKNALLSSSFIVTRTT